MNRAHWIAQESIKTHQWAREKRICLCSFFSLWVHFKETKNLRQKMLLLLLLFVFTFRCVWLFFLSSLWFWCQHTQTNWFLCVCVLLHHKIRSMNFFFSAFFRLKRRTNKLAQDKNKTLCWVTFFHSLHLFFSKKNNVFYLLAPTKQRMLLFFFFHPLNQTQIKRHFREEKTKL